MRNTVNTRTATTAVITPAISITPATQYSIPAKNISRQKLFFKKDICELRKIYL